MLLASKALVPGLAWLVASAPIFAQSVTATGDVSPFPAVNPQPDWTVGLRLNVGNSGDGTLNIEAGGAVNNTSGAIGFESGSSGTVTVTGPGSTWTNSGSLDVGYSGHGTLNIGLGGGVSNTYSYIGYSSNAIGTVTVTGPGSTWTNSGVLTVGYHGNGILNIEAGSAVSSTEAYLGNSPNAIGTVTVTGTGSTWTNSGSLAVGDYGDGTLNIEGGTVSNESGYIALYPGSTGVVTVAGTGSTWTNDVALIVGSSGKGALNIEAGGAVSNAYGYIGNAFGSTGIVTVTGPYSTWTNSGLLVIGFSGKGTLNIEAGGAVSNTEGIINYGYNSDLAGAVTVTGPGSTWTNSGNLTVGYQGNGTLSIEDGGAVGNTTGYVGYNSASNSTVTVTGTDSTWTNNGLLEVGYFGHGTLNIEAGGVVSNTDGYVGDYSNSTGTVTVIDTDSTWTNRGSLIVGRSGNGRLNIEAGGAVGSTDGYVGDYSDSIGTVTVTGANSTWTNTGSLIVGSSGNGTLEVEAGGAVNNESGYIGLEPASIGVVIVTGTDSTLTSDISLSVGSSGKGTLNIEAGGTVSADIVDIASFSGSTGALNMGAAADQLAITAGTLDTPEVAFGAGTGSLTFNHLDTTGGYRFSPDLSGGQASSTIKHIAGLTTLTGNGSNFAGNTAVSGGTLRVDGSLGGATKVDNGGTLRGTGSLKNVNVLDGGTLLGHQGKVLAMNTLVLNDAANVNVELGTPGNTAGLFDIAGDLTLDGILSIEDMGGFGAGIYRLMDYRGTLTDNGMRIGAVPSGTAASDFAVQTAIGNQVNLASTAGVTLNFWDGPSGQNNGIIAGGPGIWDSASNNWTDENGVFNGPWANGRFAVFQGVGDTVTVAPSAGIAVDGMQFAVDGYTVTGDPVQLQTAETIVRVGDGSSAGHAMTATLASSLSGSGSLVKTDHGTLILSGVNSYAGGTVVRGGVLQVASDHNLGNPAGGLTLDNARLRTTADITAHRAVALAGTHGTFDTASGTTLSLSAGVSGAGSLVKTGTGTLALTGHAAYAGNTFVQEGTLMGRADTIGGTLVNDGITVFDQAANGRFAGDVVGGGLVIKDGAGALTLSGNSTAPWRIDDGMLSSAADRFSGDVAIHAGATMHFDQRVDAVYGAQLTGTGTLLKMGSGLLQLSSGAEGFAGATHVAAGTLRVNHTLGGTLQVLDTGRLEGIGEVGSTVVKSGGTIAPGVGGDTIGTLRVNGDIHVEAGSQVEVNIAPQLDSDLIAASGVASIGGGIVTVNSIDGVYTPGSRWTILSAQGGRTGEFDSLIEAMPYVDLTLAYDDKAVFLDATRNTTDFCLPGFTSEACSTADGVQSLGPGQALTDLIAALADKASAARAFNALSGEIHASAKTALIEDSRFVREAATDRIRAAFHGVAASSTPVLAYAGGEAMPALPTTDRFAAWGQGFGAWGHTDSDGNAARLGRSTSGVLLGADAQVFNTWRLGVIAGYSHTRYDADDRDSSGTSDNYHFGLYGGTQRGQLGVRSGLAYTWHDLGTQRSVAFTGFSDSLKADYKAGTLQAFGELGYRIDTPAAALEPFANVAYVNLQTDGFAEQGGLAALSSHSQRTETSFTTLGLRAARTLMLGATTTTVRGTLGWRHAFGDITPFSRQAFTGSDTFAIAGVPIAKDSAVVEAGLDLTLSPTATLGLSYLGQIAADAQQHGLKANLAIRF